MPNTKIYVDQKVWHTGSGTDNVLRLLRQEICSSLNVSAAACQIAVIPVFGLADQPQVNVELMILPAENRTRELLSGLAEAIRQRLADHWDHQISVRISTLDPLTYVVLK